jgi:hypothetical protein
VWLVLAIRVHRDDDIGASPECVGEARLKRHTVAAVEWQVHKPSARGGRHGCRVVAGPVVYDDHVGVRQGLVKPVD